MIQFIKQNFPDYQPGSLVALEESGSDRKYYRFCCNHHSFILCSNQNQKENQAFLYFTKILNESQANVPEIQVVSTDQSMYVQSDLGNQTLLNTLKQDPEKAIGFYHRAVVELAKVQHRANDILNYNKCFSFKRFEMILVLRDLFYFKHYFLDLCQLKISNFSLLKEFEELARRIVKIPNQKFMFRDFQSRNIMIYKESVYFIDYQGGMKGPSQYDLVSLLWQAKANLSDETKINLIGEYWNEYVKFEPQAKREIFEDGYDLCVLIRLLQVLGAYGFRGIYEKKPHFIESIHFGLSNLEKIQNLALLKDFPKIENMIQQLIKEQTIQTIQNIINA